MATGPILTEYAGVGFALVTSREPVTCEWCGQKIRARTRCYRTSKWGPNRDGRIHVHQKCLLEQITPNGWHA